MARIIWTEPALQDLDKIADYISLDKPDAAKRLVQRVFARVEQLGVYPKSGSIPPELKGTPYRHLVISPLRVFYRHQKERVYIIYIMRGEQWFRDEVFFERDKGF